MSTHMTAAAEAARENYRAPDGRFGTQPAAEPDSVLTGTIEDDLDSITAADRADDRNGELARVVAGRETLRQCLRSTFPGATHVSLRDDDTYNGPALVEATGPDGEVIDLTDSTNYPSDGAFHSYDLAVEHAATSWEATVVDEAYGPATDGLRTIELHPDHEDNPWGEDWYDPDTEQPQTADAFDRFADAASQGYQRGVSDERERLVRGHAAFKDLFRAYQPDVRRVEICEEAEGPYIEGAADEHGNKVDLEKGWPEDVTTEDVEEYLSGIMTSPNDGDVPRIWGWKRDSYWVDI